MSVATDNNAATAATAEEAAPGAAELPGSTAQPGHPVAVAGALAAAIRDATRIGDLLDALRAARLWLPLPGNGGAAIAGDAVTLPTVRYLGCEFIPAYTSADLLAASADADRPRPQPAGEPAVLPHLVVRAADLARLLPPNIGIALNVGASESVPVYPQGVAYLAADEPTDARRISVGPLPAVPEELFAEIRAALAPIPQARLAAAGWLSVQFAGEGMVVSVALDDRPTPRSGTASSLRLSAPRMPPGTTRATRST